MVPLPLFIATRLLMYVTMPMLFAMTLDRVYPYWVLATSFGVTVTLLSATLWLEQRLHEAGP